MALALSRLKTALGVPSESALAAAQFPHVRAFGAPLSTGSIEPGGGGEGGEGEEEGEAGPSPVEEESSVVAGGVVAGNVPLEAPPLFLALLNSLDISGLEAEGLFRVSSGVATLKVCVAQLEEAVAKALVRALREGRLPIPFERKIPQSPGGEGAPETEEKAAENEDAGDSENSAPAPSPAGRAGLVMSSLKNSLSNLKGSQGGDDEPVLSPSPSAGHGQGSGEPTERTGDTSVPKAVQLAEIALVNSDPVLVAELESVIGRFCGPEAGVQGTHVCAGLLKRWLRELPDPLLSEELYDEFVAAVQIEIEQEKRKLQQQKQQRAPTDMSMWEQVSTDEGDVYWWNTDTQETTWEDPFAENREDVDGGDVAAVDDAGGLNDCCSDERYVEVAARLRALVLRLPAGNQLVLLLLMLFLRRVEARCEANKMTAQNLALVIAPNLLSKRDLTAIEALENNVLASNVVRMFIEHYADIFPAVQAHLYATSPPTTAAADDSGGVRTAEPAGSAADEPEIAGVDDQEGDDNGRRRTGTATEEAGVFFGRVRGFFGGGIARLAQQHNETPINRDDPADLPRGSLDMDSSPLDLAVTRPKAHAPEPKVSRPAQEPPAPPDDDAQADAAGMTGQSPSRRDLPSQSEPVGFS